MANPFFEMGREFSQWLGNAGRGAGEIARERLGVIPRLSDEVVVTVTGMPGSNKRDLYLLALTAANGVVRRFAPLSETVAPVFGSLTIQYDAADHTVTCALKYDVSMGQAVITPPYGGAGFFDTLAVYRGPQCDVVGGRFDFINDNADIPLPGIPKSSVANGLPGLPFQGSMIVTGCAQTVAPTNRTFLAKPPPPTAVLDPGTSIPSPNPKPPGDNRSRGAAISTQEELNAVAAGQYFDTNGSVSAGLPSLDGSPCCAKITALIPLVFAALSAPATNSLMQFPNPVLGPTGR